MKFELEGIEISVKYFADGIKPLSVISKGDWIDLRSAEDVALVAGEYRPIKLGIGMILPDGFEAHVAPRSSTFKNFGILLVNGIGIIDGSYCGENDEWTFPALAVRDTVIHKNDRICQFRIMRNQDPMIINTVEHLKQESRGGLGSTGIR